MKTKTCVDDKKLVFYERKNAWTLINDSEREKVMKLSNDYMGFIGKIKTEREFHDEAVNLLKKSGFKSIDEYIELKTGDKVYISEHGKALFAFVLGEYEPELGINIIGAHIDSPRIDIKQNPLYENSELCYLDTHYYGGIKKYQWLSVPLALHGVVVKKNGEKVKIVIGEKDDEPVFCITDLLPHLAQNQMKKTLSEAIEGENLDILVGSIPVKDKDVKEKVKRTIIDILKNNYGIDEEDFLSAEIEAVPAFRPREVGFDRSMIMAYGHDDRSCAYASLKAFIETDKPTYTSCLILADKEEIGSYGVTSMSSNSFEYAMACVVEKYYKTFNDIKLKRVFRKSWVLSADVNSAFDPLFQSVFEKKNTAFLNYGVCITKYTGRGGKSGASDANAEFIAEIRRIFDNNDVVWQTGELGKVDEGGGGTIAHYLARYGMEVVDCGIPVLSMHSPLEVISKVDLYMTYKAYKAFYNDKRRK